MIGSSKSQRGTTLIEAVIAFGVVMFGAAGVVALNQTSTAMMGDARRSTRATAYALDLVNQIHLWDYATETAAGGRLLNTKAANDADLGDSAGAFMTSVDPITAGLADHEEAELAGRNALDAGYLNDNDMQRFWNVATLVDANGNGVSDGVLVSVVVRWRHNASWRRMVLMTSRKNPADF